MWLVSERFWSKLLKALSAHGPNALVFPIVFVIFLYALYAGIDPILALLGLIITFGGFLYGQTSRQHHLERMAKVDVDKIVATRSKSGSTAKPKAVGKARPNDAGEK